jgi:hypothetical protein
MNIPLWELITLIVVLLNGGLAIGYFSSKYVTHSQCRQRRADCVAIRDKDRGEELDERKKVWTKIDYLYERELSRCRV